MSHAKRSLGSLRIHQILLIFDRWPEGSQVEQLGAASGILFAWGILFYLGVYCRDRLAWWGLGTNSEVSVGSQRKGSLEKTAIIFVMKFPAISFHNQDEPPNSLSVPETACLLSARSSQLLLWHWQWLLVSMFHQQKTSMTAWQVKSAPFSHKSSRFAQLFHFSRLKCVCVHIGDASYLKGPCSSLIRIAQAFSALCEY